MAFLSLNQWCRYEQNVLMCNLYQVGDVYIVVMIGSYVCNIQFGRQLICEISLYSCLKLH